MPGIEADVVTYLIGIRSDGTAVSFGNIEGTSFKWHFTQRILFGTGEITDVTLANIDPALGGGGDVSFDGFLTTADWTADRITRLTTAGFIFQDTAPGAVMTAAGPANVWIGLKNSDDVGTRFDLLAEVLKNGTVIGSGQVNGVSGGSSGFNNAILDIFNMTLSNAVAFNQGDTLSFRLSVRVAATGHRSGTARLWFNDASANSRFNAVIDGSTNSYFLRSGFTLESTAGPGPRKTIDVFVDRARDGNPFKPFGTLEQDLLIASKCARVLSARAPIALTF